MESELFGYEKGAFTGANATKKGKFEHADGGTIFLDEIGDLTFELQAKLLRVLETTEVYKIGSTTPIPRRREDCRRNSQRFTAGRE